MYHFIDDKDYLKALKETCGGIVNQLVQSIKNEGVMTVKADLVGSGAKNLITQNEKEPVDLDYNLVILECQEDINDGRFIKEYVKKKFNEILKKWGLPDCSDSTSCLSTEKRHFREGNQTEFSIDLAIITEDGDGSWYRLIHEKTGFYNEDRWFWNESFKSKGLTKKAKWIKSNSLWMEVRQAYLSKKNMYLSRRDKNHPSFNCYIEAINEVYFRYQ